MRRILYLKSTSPLPSALLGNPKDLPRGLIRICKGEPSHHVEETHFGPLCLRPQFFQSWPKAHDHNVRVVWTLLTTTERQFSNSISATTSPLCFVSHLWLNLCCLQMTSSFWSQKLSPWSSAGKVWRLSTLGWEGSPTSRGSSISGSCWWVRTGWNDFYRLFIFWLILPILSTTLSLSLLCVIVIPFHPNRSEKMVDLQSPYLLEGSCHWWNETPAISHHVIQSSTNKVWLIELVFLFIMLL